MAVEYRCKECKQTFIDTEDYDIHDMMMDPETGEVTECGGRGEPMRTF